jgi:predicted CXXCH cytochrome family protein
MHVTFLPASATSGYAPPLDRQYLLEVISVPEGVVGGPPVGYVWELSPTTQSWIQLPNYRTDNGLEGYQFAFTVTEAEAGPGDLDNDGDVDQEDYSGISECFTGPHGEAGAGCDATAFDRSDVNGDGRVDLADFALFASSFTGTIFSRPVYVGAATCTDCHSEYHADWSGTIHATAFDTLVQDGEGDNPACFPCHSVGYGRTSGFVDLDTTPHLANVQCENCHGPGSLHVGDPDNVHLEVELDSSLCGACHQSCHGMCGDYYHPHFEQWSASKHAASLSDIRWHPDYEQSCLQCHSTDYRLAPEDDKPTESEALYSLECAACHRPHGSPNASHLRLEPKELCAQCHTTGVAVPGDEPDQPQSEMLHGVGAFKLNGAQLDGYYTAHHWDIADECSGCHVHREVYGGPDHPANSGHTFEPNMRACEPCHSESEAATLVTSTQDDIGSRLTAINRYLNPIDPWYVDPSLLNPDELQQYLVAKFNYDFTTADRSYGSHNAGYVRAMLREAEFFFEVLP